jgi:hypothetical protein
VTASTGCLQALGFTTFGCIRLTMSRVLKAGVLWLAIGVIVWLVTIWRWQSAAYQATSVEIVSRLFVLPLVLTLVLLLTLWGVQRLREELRRPPSPSKGLAAARPAQTGAVEAAAHEAPGVVWAHVLAEAVVLPVGTDVESAWSALQARRCRPVLDDTLQDLDGLPVFTGRVTDLDVETWRQSWGGAPVSGNGVDEERVVRAMALLAQPLHHLIEHLVDCLPPDALPTAAEDSAHAEGTARPAYLSGVADPDARNQQRRRQASAPQLTVRVLLPSDWTERERERAVGWLRRQCGPLLDWMHAVDAQGVRWLTESPQTPESFWSEIDASLSQWAQATCPMCMLVLAVDSGVNAAHVEQLQSVGELFTARHQNGRVPGEGAVGMLLANALATAMWPPMGPRVRFTRPVRTRRERSADAAGRVGHEALASALRQLHAMAQLEAHTCLIVSDADHRAGRTAELFESLQEVMPGLDPMLAVMRVGEACGDMGMARALAPMALASHALRSGQKDWQTAVAVHVQPSHERVVLGLSSVMSDQAQV